MLIKISLDRLQELVNKSYYQVILLKNTQGEKFKAYISRCLFFQQKLYDNITLYFLRIPMIRPIILLYHKSLFYFRYKCQQIGQYIEYRMPLSTFAVLLSIICSRLHIAGYMIMVCLILIKLDFTVVSMLRFYKPRLDLLETNFPQIGQKNHLHKRNMWTSAFKVVGEAASNPQVQAVGVAVAGALAWKALDAYDTQTQKEIGDADREAMAIQAQADRDAAAIQAQADRDAAAAQAQADREAAAAQAQADREAAAAQAQKDREEQAKDREAESKRHKETLEAEALERQKDRQEENRRIAFEKMLSGEFENLSDDQKQRVVRIVQSGDLSP